MSVIRAFIAVNLTPEIQRRLDELISAFKQKLEKSAVRWVAANNIHLTLKFLGDVSLANLDLLKKLMRTEISNYRSFRDQRGRRRSIPNCSPAAGDLGRCGSTTGSDSGASEYRRHGSAVGVPT